MKLLILSRYSRLGASSRVRLYQFIPRFEAAGISCTVHPLLNDRYLHELYGKGGISRANLARGYFSMVKQVLLAGRFDLVLIEKEVFPFLPPLAEWWLNVARVPYIVDYDDAIFHNYDLSPSKLVRQLFRRKISSVMRRAVTVVCGNAYLGAYADSAGARRVLFIPTVVDTDKYVAKGPGKEGPTVIGWIGSPTSLKYLESLKPVLQALCARHDVLVHIVGAGAGIGLGNAERVLDWSEEQEADLIEEFDIGIMPLVDSPWERGKCGYKLIQYMGCALPVVGSPVGANEEIIQEGMNGFKPRTEAEWTDALEKLLRDPALRKRMGANGRELVLSSYSLEVAASNWVKEIQNTMASTYN